MRKNKGNLILGTLIPIYITFFILMVLFFAFTEEINEKFVLFLAPFHVLMMFISIYILILHIVYFDQNKELTGMEKGLWLVIYFASFGLSFPIFWVKHLSKWDRISLKTMLKHFNIR